MVEINLNTEEILSKRKSHQQSEKDFSFSAQMKLVSAGTVIFINLWLKKATVLAESSNIPHLFTSVLSQM